ncbi:YcxB family protein [Streptomyces xylophagus]|uniref:YcxB family protein n=1 Tax=Streptomyces xylophagus TaxID=285514 RepID=UPI00131AC4DD|nr:YcxB family protein [Streptomyces xylophagus]
MDMGRDDVTGHVVELVYQPTAEDFMAALRARRRVSRSARRQLWLIGPVLLFGGVAVAVALASGDSISIPLLVGMAFAVFLLVFQPRFVARQFQRLAERRGEFRVTVTDAGVSVVTDNTSTSLNWTVQPRYRETADGFYMFSPEKNALNFTLLPKRAVQGPADVDRLRAILDAHLSRVD